MKKLLLLSVIAAGLVITACGPSAEEVEAQRVADSTKMADSLAAVHAEAQRVADSTAKAQAEADSIAKASEKKGKK
jgi:protein involved in sex pheromone biosynthesis